MGCENFIRILFHMANSIKLYHWQTKSFARHKATCELFANITSLTDQFVEVYMGRYSRPSFPKGIEFRVEELSDNSAKILLKEFSDFLRTELTKCLKSSDTDLFALRDDILGEINKTMYLFTLS
jgi:hypothetical protein